MTEFLLNPVVGVFRQCDECGDYKKIASFPNHERSHVCGACYKRRFFGNRGRRNKTRTLRITPAGRAALRKWEREQQPA